MKKIITILGLVIATICISSCRKDFEFTPSTGALEFSKDTIYLDTVFTDIGSSTYTLKVYNRSDNNIEIPTVRLGEGASSKFRLNVDGMAGKEFNNVELLAKDSMFIFVETTVDITELTATETQYLYTDAIEFDTESNLQKVELVTLVQDAVFLYPNRYADGTTEVLTLGTGEDASDIYGFVLDDDELHFTNEKPYVIYGYAAVASNKTLTMDAGTRVHFHADSGIIVGDEASLQVNGDVSTDVELLENEVIFEGDRLEPDYADVPGQWGTIWLTAGSTNHYINHLTIRNASVGLLMDSNDGNDVTLSINNSQIHNSASYGLWSQTGHIAAENLVIGNAGVNALFCSYGGNYTFKHCTFANYWQNGYRGDPAVMVTNYLILEDGSAIVQDLDHCDFYNSIIYGSNNVEFGLAYTEEAAFNYSVSNSLIRFNPYGSYDEELYDFENTDLYTSIIRNEAPIFLDTDGSDFHISDESPANGTASATSGVVPVDILGTTRSVSAPDMGAYESTVWED
ncbi:hypothetical protein SAMN05216480_106112 [Pustulibacterium marinum]|uniref:Right handed beta helix region n=1 Tax=Pustulibacterium marinum TaxID=1224947 RepID=A0A1I7GZ32_9FLAO|nr:right-handed parallel beta-helix repeat-containing protein [Pustulibacterium marinum]SFU53650.1 hypothetical protein SAMN05216480_106112 [Pustulibacterium marinum]